MPLSYLKKLKYSSVHEFLGIKKQLNEVLFLKIGKSFFIWD